VIVFPIPAKRSGGEEMSNDEMMTCDATPYDQLIAELLNPCIAKSEREWAAARRIAELEESNAGLLAAAESLGMDNAALLEEVTG